MNNTKEYSDLLPLSVLLCVYNDEDYISDSIKSILNQTIDDFQLIIIDDGSMDKTNEIIRSFVDPRIKIIKNESNLGLTKSLNIGLSYCTGRYCARIDSDDIAVENRFELQINYLDNNPSIMALGSFLIKILPDNSLEDVPWPTGLEATTQAIITGNNPIAHPAAMFRTEFVRKVGGYDERFQYTQDYSLWVRMFIAGAKFDNLQEHLTLYRIHKNQRSVLANEEQSKCHARIIREFYFDYISKVFTDNELELFMSIFIKKIKKMNSFDYFRLSKSLKKIITKYNRNTSSNISSLNIISRLAREHKINRIVQIIGM